MPDNATTDSAGRSAVQFSAEDFQRLRQLSRKLTDLLPEFDRAERCQIDCSGLRAIAQQMQQRLMALEKEFMTPAP